MYNSLLIDQSLALNRRRDDEGDVKTEDLNLNADDHENEVSWCVSKVQWYVRETISIPSKVLYMAALDDLQNLSGME